MGGYAYNCVMPHNWLYNITVLPSFGYKRSHLGKRDQGDACCQHADENEHDL